MFNNHFTNNPVRVKELLTNVKKGSALTFHACTLSKMSVDTSDSFVECIFNANQRGHTFQQIWLQIE